MVVALTPRQWKALVEATGLHEAFELVEKLMDVDLSKEGDRFAAREVLGAILKPWTITRTLEEIARDLRPPRRLLGPVPDVHAAGRRGPALLDREPDVRAGRAARHRHLPDARLAAGASPSIERLPAAPAPALGEHTDEVLADVLGLTDAEIGRLHDDGVVAGPTAGGRLSGTAVPTGRLPRSW